MAWTNRVPLPPGWNKIKAGILDRDGYRCRIQGPRCTGQATTADHILCRAEGGSLDDPRNLQAACETCHSEKTKAEAARGRARTPRERRPNERHPGLA